MAVTIDATAGGASANSYATLAEANTYMEGRLNASTWETDASDDDKNRALVEATRELTTLIWGGYQVTATQALAWPRQWAFDPDSPIADYYATTVVPQRVKNATMELAFQFVKAGTTDVAALEASQGVMRKKVDVLETEYAKPYERVTGLKRYPRVWKEIARLLNSAPSSTRLVRG